MNNKSMSQSLLMGIPVLNKATHPEFGIINQSTIKYRKMYHVNIIYYKGSSLIIYKKNNKKNRDFDLHRERIITIVK